MYVCKAKTDICQFFFCFFVHPFLRDVLRKKRHYVGIFPILGGGSDPNPLFLSVCQFFLHAKIILRCQNMFYNRGEVISDQFGSLDID